MNADEVPRSMKQARDEVLLALSSSSKASSTRHCNRAASLLNEAVHEIQAHPAQHYDWSLLRGEH